MMELLSTPAFCRMWSVQKAVSDGEYWLDMIYLKIQKIGTFCQKREKTGHSQLPSGRAPARKGGET